MFLFIYLFEIFIYLELRFKSNPLKDTRLKKLMEQDKLKPVLEYLSKQWNEQQKTTTATTTISKSVTSKSTAQPKKTEEIQDKIEILHFDQPGEFKGRQSLFFIFTKNNSSFYLDFFLS